MVVNELKYKVVYNSDQLPWTHTSYFSEYHVAKSFWHMRNEEDKNPVLYEIKTVRTETVID